MQVEAFAHLGLPQWFRIATGWIALAGVVGLIFGFWNEIVLVLAALWIACIMLELYCHICVLKIQLEKSCQQPCL